MHKTDPTHEVYLSAGLDNLHAITFTDSYRLRIEMEDHYGRKSHADYGFVSQRHKATCLKQL